MDCIAPEEEGETEGRLGKVDIDVGTLTMPVSQTMPASQKCFDLAIEVFGKDCSRTSPLVACWQAVMELEGGHSDIDSRWDQRTRHHRHCRNLTACASPNLGEDDLGPVLLEAHIVLEAHAHTVVDCSH